MPMSLQTTPSRDLVFYVQLQVKPECVADWKEDVTELIERMAQEATFVTCYMHQDTTDAHTFTLYERWSEPSVDAFMKNQMTKSYRHSYEQKLPSLLQEPRNASVLKYVREWHAAV